MYFSSYQMPEMTEVDKPAVAEVKPEQSGSSSETDTDDEIPELEDAGTGAPGTAAFPGAAASGLPIDMVSKAKQSRGEKKARKIMSKLGLKPVRYPQFILKNTKRFIYLKNTHFIIKTTF